MKKIALIFGAAIACTFCGCAFNEDSGASVTVGEVFNLPEITTPSGEFKIRIFQDVNGAHIWTAKDSRVTVKFHTVTTNDYTIARTGANTKLDVVVEPTETASNAEGEKTPADEQTQKTIGE